MGKMWKPCQISFSFNFMKYTAMPGIKLLMRTKISYGGDLARGTRYMDKGMVIVANHSWWIDSALLYYVFRRVYCRSLAAKDVAEVNKSWGFFEKAMGCVLLDRTGFDWNALKTTTTDHLFCFGPASSFFLELFLCSSPVVCWKPSHLEGSSSGVTSFCLFILFMAFLRQEHWSGLPFPPPVDHVLADL